MTERRLSAKRDAYPNGLRKVLAELGMSQEKAAAACGMSQSYLNRLAAGRIDPRVTTARRVAKGLGRSMDEVFGAN